MADEDKEDPVVQEVDVFLAKSLADNLYLFQYPVRPCEVPYDRVPHIGARIKPQQQKVEIELALNTESSNYYAPRGEQIATDVDSTARGSSDKELYYASGQMDKQLLVSSRAAVSAAHYAVGVLREGELHLTPLQGILQLRPNLEYMDKAEKNTQQAASQREEGDSQDEEEDAKAVTVRFARPETARAKAHRMSTFQYLEKKEAEEQWANLQYYPPQHSMASMDRDKLYCADVGTEAPEISLSAKEYLDLLTPSSSKQESSQPKMPSNVLSMTQLKTMDLQDQVKALLINAKLMSFSQLCSLLSPVAKEAVLIKCVQQYGMLVQGCWVVKSELLYPEGTVSPNSGIPSEILCRGRDYIMWRYTQSRVIVRKDIATVTKLPNEDIKEMLDQMSKMRVAQGWEFTLPYDTEFIHKHPEVNKQQLTNWEAKYQILASQLNLSKIHEKGSADHKKTQDGVHGTESKKGIKTTKPMANHVLLEANSLQNMNNNDETPPRSASPMEVDCKDVYIKEQNNHVVTKGPLTAESEHFDEIFKRLQDFVCEKLHRTVLSFSEFKKLLLLKQTACEQGDLLCSGVSDSLLEDAILATGATEINVQWPTVPILNDLHSRKLYAFRCTGETSTDKLREVLLDMFQESHCVKKADFQAKATEVTGCVPSKKDWATLQQDLLEKGKHPTYYLRGTSTILAGL